MRRWGAVLTIMVAAACAPGPAPRAGDAVEEPGGTPPPAARGEPAGDSARVARLEREARALARADGCGAAGACRAAPLGSRPCGGPREYLVYCATTTDTAALFAKLAELGRAEEAYNRERELFSTCEFREPPAVELAGGSCRAVPRP